VAKTSNNWGGRREGAGRPPKGLISSEPHKKRESFSPKDPLHITLRLDPAVTGSKKQQLHEALRASTLVVAKWEDFHIVHLGIRGDKVHLIVEAENKASLSRGMQAFQISAAKQLNRTISKHRTSRRRGRVFADRYRMEVLKSPKSVRDALSTTQPAEGLTVWTPRTVLLRRGVT